VNKIEKNACQHFFLNLCVHRGKLGGAPDLRENCSPAFFSLYGHSLGSNSKYQSPNPASSTIDHLTRAAARTIIILEIYYD
jgi:hypothetical protein